MFDKIRPLGDRVLVKRVPTEERTVSGLFIPEAAKEKAQMGAVMAVGTGHRDRDGRIVPVEVQVNDIIFFGKYSGDEVKVKDTNGKDVEIKVIRLDSILAKVID